MSNKLKIAQTKLDEQSKQLEEMKTRPVKNLEARDYDNQVETNPKLRVDPAEEMAKREKEGEVVRKAEVDRMMVTIKERLEERLKQQQEQWAEKLREAQTLLEDEKAKCRNVEEEKEQL